MAPRFYSSPYKNAVAQLGKKDQWWTELPVSSSAASDSSDLIKTCSDYWLAQGSASGSLVCHAYDNPGKFNQRAPTLQVASRALTTFDVSRFDDLVAAGTEDGKIAVHELPSLQDFADGASVTPRSLLSVSHPSTRPVDVLSFHPTSSGLLLASSQSIVAIYDVQSGAAEPALKIEQSSPSWSAQWSGDGRLISTTAKDGALRVWDVRKDGQKPAMEFKAHGGLKCSRHVWLGGSASEQIFTTGFSRMREREYSLFDTRGGSGSALKTQRLDTNTGTLIPVVDQERNIVYLAGRGDMTLHWVEVGGPSTFTQGGTPVPITISSLALAPPSALNLMKAEINRVMLLTSEAVVPVPVEVPRRQYIDFHSELFPAVPARVAAQDAQAWIAGGDSLVDLVAQDPTKKAAAPIKRMPSSSASAPASQPTAPVATSASAATSTAGQSPSTVSAPAPPVSSSVERSSASSLAERAQSTSSPSLAPAPASTPASSSQPTFGSSKAAPTMTSPASTPSLAGLSMKESSTPTAAPSSNPLKPSSASAQANGEPFNPGWSRKFLIGKTPLKPDYHDVHGLSATMSADTQMLKANREFLFFPLGGPGGRLAVHPFSATGRLPTHIPSVVCGATIVEFEISPFEKRQVYVASDDSKIRVFELPEGGLAEDLGEPKFVMGDSKMDKINELKHHPTAKGLLLSVSEDRGNPTLRLWDVTKGVLLSSVSLPAGSISSAAWSPDGRLIALATKTKQILLLDPRSLSSLASCPSHDSPRPVRLAWASPSHLISTGFNRAASRELILYSATLDQLAPLAKEAMDVSPAPLFPFVDLDTNILLLYSRGDRSCLAYEVHPGEVKGKQFQKLPSFEHATLQLGWAFLPKQGNDIKEVEILSSLRLTSATVEKVSWTVPRRAHGEHFQDDVFIPTADVETSTLTADEWMAGKNCPLALIDLRPEGLTPLSQAPATVAKASTRSKITGPVLTESQKAEAHLARLFAAAKAEGDEEEEPIRSNNAPDDDDW